VIILSDTEYEIDLLRRLVSIKSISGNGKAYSEISKIIKQELEKLRFDVHILDGNEEAKDGIPRPNIVGIKNIGANKTLGLLTHYDVVPPGDGWKTDPFNLTISEKQGEIRAYGRGAADDKGCIAAALGALRKIINKEKKLQWNIVFMSVADEEIGGRFGAGYVARKHMVDLDALIVLDASSLGLVIGASGIVHGQIIIHGKSGHAGYIFGSENALHRAIIFLNNFLSFINFRSTKLSKLKNMGNIPIPNLWGRFSFTWIKTPTYTYNIVPSDVIIGFDMRLIPEENVDTALAELKSYFEMTKYRTSIYDVELKIIRAFPGYATSENNEFIKDAHKALLDATGRKLPIIGMLGGNDGGWFRDYNIPMVSFGVWDEKSNIHGANESVSLKKILELEQFLANLILG